MKKKIKLAYSNLKNAGDLMNVDIVEKIGKVKIIRSKTFCADMTAIGGALVGLQYEGNFIKKIFQKIIGIIYDKKPLYVWGSGFLHDYNDNKLYRKNLKICALRGKKTKEKLEKITGKKYDNVLLADAGLLVSELINCTDEKKYQIGLIPHMWHQNDKAFKELSTKKGVHFIDITQTPQKVAMEISQCETIISSSLHGLVFADSLGVPNIHVLGEKELRGDNFKFEDYYSSFNIEDKPRKLSEYTPTYKEIIESYRIRKEDVDTKKRLLIKTFPNI